jgi:hypothetical protein
VICGWSPVGAATAEGADGGVGDGEDGAEAEGAPAHPDSASAISIDAIRGDVIGILTFLLRRNA